MGVPGLWNGEAVSWPIESWDAMHAEQRRREAGMKWWQVLLQPSMIDAAEMRYQTVAWQVRCKWDNDYDPRVELEHGAPVYGDPFHIRTGKGYGH